MKRTSRARQAGISFFGLVFVLAVLAAVGILVAQAVPTVLEYQAIVKAMNRAKDGSNPAEVRAAFQRSRDVDDITSVSGKDLEITQQDGRMVVKVAYNKEIHMFGPAFLLLKYAHEAK
ncbi:DUF4845 domain-containing protein [Ramlibacter algicola]|uniref:DUF4845 domain-containing protein n=1 Tax=Ramlibacter algicola TaxID=2795217 RepID=A0A934USJ4_9BURK|nr:DUF4845 domain-containing protein [Ramlibacter algicola]MBK0394315.1 DUF4845 domain-containing protein [Ramlibacter algicola]